MWKSKNNNALQDNDIIPPDVEDPPLAPRQPPATPNMPPQRPSSFFPESLPPRPEPVSWQERNCPGSRFCWPLHWDSWSLVTDDKAALMRRICMWTTLLTRTMLSILGLVFRLYGVQVAEFIIGSILAVIGFFFIAWCLARIGDATGTRKVLGVHVGRWHYDVFLLGSALIHILLVVIVFIFHSRFAYLTTWYGMWLLIFAVAWITTWTPDQPSYV